MKKFNRNRHLDKKVKNEIEEYFKFRWGNDKSLAISEPEDAESLE